MWQLMLVLCLVPNKQINNERHCVLCLLFTFYFLIDYALYQQLQGERYDPRWDNCLFEINEKNPRLTHLVYFIFCCTELI